MNAHLSRRAFALGALASMPLARAAAARPAGVTAVDVLGRTVTLPAPARRIVLAQGRQLNSLGLLHPDPISLLAGWGADFRHQAPDAWARYAERFPAIASIPIVGDGATPAGFSLERTVALAPDLVVLSRGATGGDGKFIARLEAAGLNVVVVDFFQQPLKDTAPSLRALGALLGVEERASRFLDFYEGRLKHIAGRIAGAPRPTVFMHAHAGGGPCCASPARGTLNDFIQAAGGDNVAAALLPGATGQISLEQLIVANPRFYVATGGRHMERLGGFVLGLGVDQPTAARSFARLLSTPGISSLDAVVNGRASGIWHLFNDTPLHVAAIERLAKWFHPDRFADVDPDATLAEAAAFSPIPLDGALWIEQERS